MEGIIIKALSGFYYVISDGNVYECRARGKFRLDGSSPLVGDRVSFEPDGSRGIVTGIFPRRNFFIRPAVANIDALVFIAANTNPVTDPFLIDRVSVIASEADCELVVCINKTDLNSGDELRSVYTGAGFETYCVSAETGAGIVELRAALSGRICALTGNSGVGKSSILNAMLPELKLPVGEVSEKLGRGRHTTRHVELIDAGDGTYIADTPGFASFEIEMMQTVDKARLQYDFREFEPYIGRCRFSDCAHLREPGCAVLSAVAAGKISKSRHSSYARLYELASKNKFWEA